MPRLNALSAPRPAANGPRFALRWFAGVALMSLAGMAAAQVGMAQMAVDDLPVTLVYPTAQVAKLEVRGPFEIQVAVNAAPQPGQRRLIVLSHGTAGNPLADFEMASTLAKAGFVVAQPLHKGDNNVDYARAGPDAWKTRPAEVTRVIDALAKDPEWAPRLALDKVGVHGMSAGGLSGLTMAGAQWRLINIATHCMDNADADAGFCFSGITNPEDQAKRRAGYERARGIPEEFLPSELTDRLGGRDAGDTPGAVDVRPDPRVAVVTVAVPLAALVSPESLASIRIPVGVVSADRDEMLLPKFHSEYVLHECKACIRLAEVTGAGHMDLLAPWPAVLAQIVGAKQPRGGLPVPGFDPKVRDAAFQKVADFYKERLAQ